MNSTSNSNSKDLDLLLSRVVDGDHQALASLFDLYRNRLRQMVKMRLDRRLQGRLDPSDVVQEAFVDATQQLPAYIKKHDQMPFFIWLRLLTGQRLLRLHRQHLGAEMRAVGREISLYRGSLPRTSSVFLAEQLLGRFTSPSQAAMRAEMQFKLQEALNTMDTLDREIIVLRHFEEISNNDAAQLLGLTKAAASNRYVRALSRLQSVLESVPGFMDESLR